MSELSAGTGIAVHLLLTQMAALNACRACPSGLLLVGSNTERLFEGAEKYTAPRLP